MRLKADFLYFRSGGGRLLLFLHSNRSLRILPPERLHPGECHTMTEENREQVAVKVAPLSNHRPNGLAVQREFYEIRGNGDLDSDWSEWFDGATITC
jgi:hypothetical protein